MHAAVAEEVERPPERRERAHASLVEVDRVPVEGMVDVPGAVALGDRRAPVRRLPLTPGHEEGRARELGDSARVVVVQVRHDDEPHIIGVDATLAKLRWNCLLGLHLDGLGPGGGHEPPEVFPRVLGHRGVEAGVDQERSEPRVLDQERHERDRHPVVARLPESERAQLRERAAATVRPGVGPGRLPA